MNTAQATVSLRSRITSMNSVPLDVVRVPVAELEVVLQEIQRLHESPLTKRCYIMSESQLDDYRLVVGFKSLPDVHAAHEFVISQKIT